MVTRSSRNAGSRSYTMGPSPQYTYPTAGQIAAAQVNLARTTPGALGASLGGQGKTPAPAWANMFPDGPTADRLAAQAPPGTTPQPSPADIAWGKTFPDGPTAKRVAAQMQAQAQKQAQGQGQGQAQGPGQGQKQAQGQGPAPAQKQAQGQGPAPAPAPRGPRPSPADIAWAKTFPEGPTADRLRAQAAGFPPPSGGRGPADVNSAAMQQMLNGATGNHGEVTPANKQLQGPGLDGQPIGARPDALNVLNSTYGQGSSRIAGPNESAELQGPMLSGDTRVPINPATTSSTGVQRSSIPPDWQQQIMDKYPEIKNGNSEANHTFLQAYSDAVKNQGAWNFDPLKLADDTMGKFYADQNKQPAAPPSSAKPGAPASPAPGTPPAQPPPGVAYVGKAAKELAANTGPAYPGDPAANLPATPTPNLPRNSGAGRLYARESQTAAEDAAADQTQQQAQRAAGMSGGSGIVPRLAPDHSFPDQPPGMGDRQTLDQGMNRSTRGMGDRQTVEQSQPVPPPPAAAPAAPSAGGDNSSASNSGASNSSSGGVPMTHLYSYPQAPWAMVGATDADRAANRGPGPDPAPTDAVDPDAVQESKDDEDTLSGKSPADPDGEGEESGGADLSMAGSPPPAADAAPAPAPAATVALSAPATPPPAADAPAAPAPETPVAAAGYLPPARQYCYPRRTRVSPRAPNSPRVRVIARMPHLADGYTPYSTAGQTGNSIANANAESYAGSMKTGMEAQEHDNNMAAGSDKNDLTEEGFTNNNVSAPQVGTEILNEQNGAKDILTPTDVDGEQVGVTDQHYAPGATANAAAAATWRGDGTGGGAGGGGASGPPLSGSHPMSAGSTPEGAPNYARGLAPRQYRFPAIHPSRCGPPNFAFGLPPLPSLPAPSAMMPHLSMPNFAGGVMGGGAGVTSYPAYPAHPVRSNARAARTPSVAAAMARERAAIRARIGGARPGDRPKLTHLRGVGPAVINTGEKVVPTPNGDAVFNRQMLRAARGAGRR